MEPLQPFELLAPLRPLEKEEATRLRTWLQALPDSQHTAAVLEDVAETFRAYLFASRPWGRTSRECFAELLFLAGLTPTRRRVQAMVTRAPLACFEYKQKPAELSRALLGIRCGGRSWGHWSYSTAYLLSKNEGGLFLRTYLEGRSLLGSLQEINNGSQITRVLKNSIAGLEPEFKAHACGLHMNADALLGAWTDWRRIFLSRLAESYEPLQPVSKQAAALRKQGWQLK